MHQDFPTKKYETSLHSGYSLTYFSQTSNRFDIRKKRDAPVSLYSKLTCGFLSVKHVRRSTRARLTTHDHDPRPTTHNARPSTHDVRRTTHYPRPTYPRDLDLRGLMGASLSVSVNVSFSYNAIFLSSVSRSSSVNSPIGGFIVAI